MCKKYRVQVEMDNSSHWISTLSETNNIEEAVDAYVNVDSSLVEQLQANITIPLKIVFYAYGDLFTTYPIDQLPTKEEFAELLLKTHFIPCLGSRAVLETIIREAK